MFLPSITATMIYSVILPFLGVAHSVLGIPDAPLRHGTGDTQSATRSPLEGQIRLSGSNGSHEGNVEIFHQGMWSGVCDDGWTMENANVTCFQLNFPLGASGHFNRSAFGRGLGHYWLDDVICTGTERSLEQCQSSGWGRHNCRFRQNVGVKCRIGPLPDIQLTTLKDQLGGAGVALELLSTNDSRAGLVIASHSAIGRILICADQLTFREGNVVCGQLGMGFAKYVGKEYLDVKPDYPIRISGLYCTGNEETLNDCIAHPMNTVNCRKPENSLTVICTEKLPDLMIDVPLLEDSAYLHDQSLFYLQCAMEEYCVDSSVYSILKDPYWPYYIRRLLRFSTSVFNIGTAPFRPHAAKESWEWHSCHMHHHSMEVFSHYDVLDKQTMKKLAEGHKASFCLEDSNCNDGVDKFYSCAGYGDQGISVGCWDEYLHDIDCQWIDFTGVAPGSYFFKVSINPDYRIPEMNFTNNAALCDLYYDAIRVYVTDCRLVAP